MIAHRMDSFDIHSTRACPFQARDQCIAIQLVRCDDHVYMIGHNGACVNDQPKLGADSGDSSTDRTSLHAGQLHGRILERRSNEMSPRRIERPSRNTPCCENLRRFAAGIKNVLRANE
jgi:hypothetical protein